MMDSNTAVISPRSGEKGPTFLVILFVVAGFGLFGLAAVQFVTFHEIGKGLALVLGGGLAFLTAAVLRFPSGFSSLAVRPSIVRVFPIAVALLWLIWIGSIAVVHRVQQWDEAAYILSGMAIWGDAVPYASHRAPVTGVLCAIFAGGDRLLNPVLLGVLLLVLFRWLRRRLGPVPAAGALLVLLCQNLFLESTVDLMSELPAALLTLAGFLALAKGRLSWSALWFALLVFTRWNLAPVWAVVFFAVLWRFGVRSAAKFIAAGFALFALWYLATVAMGIPDPVRSVYEGNFLAALAWAPTADQKPDFLIRLKFYASHFFFLTPAVLLGLIASPLQNLRKHSGDEMWVVLVVAPLASLAYLATMLSIGGLFPRFVTPLIPTAIVCWFVWLSRLRPDHPPPDRPWLAFASINVFLAMAVGLWPLSAAVIARANHQTPPAIFAATFRNTLVALDRTVSLKGIALAPLSHAGGQPAMVETRHAISFPSARADYTASVIEDPDSIESVRRLIAACRPGDHLLVPAKYRAEGGLPLVVVAFDEHWALVRIK